MTSPIAIIREALKSAICAYDGACKEFGCKEYFEALEALDQVEARYVPELPEGWELKMLTSDLPKYDTWQVSLSNGKSTAFDCATTINAAVKAAIKATEDK